MHHGTLSFKTQYCDVLLKSISYFLSTCFSVRNFMAKVENVPHTPFCIIYVLCIRDPTTPQRIPVAFRYCDRNQSVSIYDPENNLIMSSYAKELHGSHSERFLPSVLY